MNNQDSPRRNNFGRRGSGDGSCITAIVSNRRYSRTSSVGSPQHDGSPTQVRAPRRKSKSTGGVLSGPIIYLFKGSNTHKQQDFQEVDALNSLESVTSIISAITLPDFLACVPEGEAGSKFCNQGGDSMPKRPARQSTKEAEQRNR